MTSLFQDGNRIEGAGALAEAAVIEARHLVKEYSGGVRALQGLSFTVGRGAILALLGPNGAGKSTVMRIMATLARPDSGAVRIAGIDALADPRAVRRLIGYVAQRSGADPLATGWENLRFQGRLHGLRGRRLEERASELVAAFDLGGAAGRPVHTYSGGTRRRLDVAMAFIHKPPVLLLDEPTAGLDPEVRAAMWERIARLTREEGMSVLLTTHYLEEADQLAHRVAIIDRGRLVAQGSPEKLKSALRGETVRLELEEPRASERARAVLERVGGVREVVAEGGWLHARADGAPRLVPALLQALDEAGIAVASVTLARPSLDDVYLQHTGRAFSRPSRGEALP